MICVNSVSVYPSSVTLKIGEWYYGVSAEVCPTYADCKSIRWYSSNSSVASVNVTTGYIYARSAGTARIYAEATDSSGCRDYITVTVTSGTIKVSSVELNRSYVSIEEGETFTLSATVCPVNANNRTLCWSSSNTSVAAVNSSGKVTAKSRGMATITATAQDGSGMRDCCDIYVTGDILVSSVSISPLCKTTTVGNSFNLHETVCPTNATNKCVTWSSSNASVATVNSSGLVLAKSIGNATITATAADGSGKKGYCIVTVNTPIRVESVEVCPAIKSMNVGETEYLSATVCPYNATNKSVIWCSSDERVATIGIYTGFVRAIKAGTVTITATTVDGGYSSSLSLKVIIDTVTIQKDGAFNKVVFSNSGKVWRCINRDTIYDEDYIYNTILNQRSNHNFFTYYNENDPLMSNTTPKEYTDEENKLLYAIDPYGVANYVQRYASELFYEDDLAGVLGYKDRIFKLLFKRNPKYFARTLSGTWYETDDKSNLSAVLSESEEIFGMHPIYDALTILALCGFALDIAGIVFSTTFFATGTIKACIGKIGKTCVRVLSIGEAVVKNELMSYTSNSIIESAFEKTDLAWACTFVSIYEDLQEIADSIISEPNYNREILDYCIHDTGYVVYVELKNGTKYTIDDICSAMNNH